jgi:hypothetical protein
MGMEAALEELDESDNEAELAPAPPISRRSADAGQSSLSSSFTRPERQIQGEASICFPEETSTPSIDNDPLRLRTICKGVCRARGEWQRWRPFSFSLTSKTKTTHSRRAADAVMAEDSESEAPRASSSKPRGSRLDSADVDGNDRTSPDPLKRKRKTTTGRKPTVKVNLSLCFIGSY